MKMDNVWVVFLDGSVTVKQIIMPYSIFPVTKQPVLIGMCFLLYDYRWNYRWFDENEIEKMKKSYGTVGIWTSLKL